MLVDDRVLGPMRTALNRRLAVVVLDTFPIRNRGDDVPVANRLRDAIRCIEQRAAERPSVPEIAAACGLSQRGLQDVFARTLVRPRTASCGTTARPGVRGTPARGRHGRRHRDRAPVGVHEPGRLAVAYRDRFGEDPAVTLRTFAGRAPGLRSRVLAPPARPRPHPGPPGRAPHAAGPGRRGRRASATPPAALPGGTGRVPDGGRPFDPCCCRAQRGSRFPRAGLTVPPPGYGNPGRPRPSLESS